MLTWTPDPLELPWMEVQEDEVWTSPVISAVDESLLLPLEISGYSFEVVGPYLTGLVVAADLSGVTASTPKSLIGSFPPVDLEYQIKGVTGHCANFGELPKEADQVIKYLPHPVNQKDWILRVTAKLSDGSTEAAEFVLNVRANYNPGLAALKDAVNARRNPPR